jgi:hypothetical protein
MIKYQSWVKVQFFGRKLFGNGQRRMVGYQSVKSMTAGDQVVNDQSANGRTVEKGAV